MREREGCGLVYIQHCSTNHIVRLNKQDEFISYLRTYLQSRHFACYIVDSLTLVLSSGSKMTLRTGSHLRMNVFLIRPLGAKVETFKTYI